MKSNLFYLIIGCLLCIHLKGQDCPPVDAVPFNCSGSLYQVANGQLFEYDPVNQTAVSINNIGDNPMWGQINAIGYNVNDNFLYGMGTTDPNDGLEYLVLIDATGTYYSCGALSNFTSNNIPVIGTMDAAGNLIFQRDGQLHILDVSVSPPSVVSYCLVGGLPFGGYNDFALNPIDGLIYVASDQADAVYTIDPNNIAPPTASCPNGEITINVLCNEPMNTNVTPDPTSGCAFGAQWFDSNGNFFVSCNQLGQYYIIDYNTCSFIIPPGGGQGPSSSTNDGGSCIFSSNPFCITSPEFNLLSTDSNPFCGASDLEIDFEVTNYEANNNSDGIDFDVSFVYFNNPTPDPYTGGTSLGTAPFGSISNGSGTYTIPTGVLTSGTYYVYSIFEPAPTDTECQTSGSLILTYNAPPMPTLTCPAELNTCLGTTYNFMFDDLNPDTEAETAPNPIIGGPDAGLISNAGTINLNNLNPGAYTFTLNYESPDGCLGTPATCTFTITAPASADAGAFDRS